MRILLILFCGLTLSCRAEIYQWQDEGGGKHFSDRSHPDAEIIDIDPGYGFYTVTKVHDGDTVVLNGKIKVRLLGINTPEVEHKEHRADAGGDEARQWLIDKLENKKVRLVTDSEKTDKYGRTLAHLFTESKEHVNLQLVEAGLAEVNIYPPNLLFADELVKAQDKAEQQKLGIWQRDEYAVKPANSLAGDDSAGWVRLVDKVTRVRHTRKYVYLEFESPLFDARIERKWLALFPDVNDYIGKTLETRGWVNKKGGRFSMLIRHPSALKVKNS